MVTVSTILLSTITVLSVGAIMACCKSRIGSLGKRSREEHSSMDPESKRARLDEAEATTSTSNQVAPEPVPEAPLCEEPSGIASPSPAPSQRANSPLADNVL